MFFGISWTINFTVLEKQWGVLCFFFLCFSNQEITIAVPYLLLTEGSNEMEISILGSGVSECDVEKVSTAKVA